MDLCEDRAWLDGYRRGDPAALERVYRAYAPLVFRVIKGGRVGTQGAFLQQVAEEEDALQEVFLQVLSASTRARYDGVRPFANLLAVITRNVVAGRLRSQGRAREDLWDPHGPPLEQWTPGQPLPDTVLLSKEEEQAAAALWQALDEDEKKLARIRYEQGMSQRDAAVALGVSRQNLRTLEARLRTRMDGILRTLGFSQGPNHQEVTP